MEALGQPSEISTLAVGSAAPGFTLTAATGESVSLDQYRGKVVLLDFWQTWSALRRGDQHLKSLQEKYWAQCLVVLRITEKLDQDGVTKMRQFLRE